MNQYHSQLAKFKAEAESPYNDGWNQQYYLERYDELMKMGEKKFNQKNLKEKIENLEKMIDFQKKSLKLLKEELKNL